MKTIFKTLIFVPLALFAVQSQAAIINLTAMLSSANEIPAVTVPSSGVGAGVFTLDTDTNQLSWAIAYMGLTAPALAAHLHGQAPMTVPGAANGGVEVDLANDPGAMFATLGSQFGGFVGSTMLTAMQASNVLDNLWYVNIHTLNNPAGEIRGQVRTIAGIPEPATLPLIALGVAGLVGLRRLRNARTQPLAA